MKILILDDQARRYETLIMELITLGISRDSIIISGCSTKAASILQDTYFDLLILDLLLPLWPESEPDLRNSLDLLFEIHNSEKLHRPGRIIGITADNEIANQNRDQFSDYAWTIINYSEKSDSWIRRIENCVKYILGENANPSTDNQQKKSLRIDLAIICALRHPELDEVLKLPWNWDDPEPIDDNTFIRRGRFTVEGTEISVCAAHASRMGMISTALLSTSIINNLRPKLLVMCGICAGVHGKTKIGDVLLADPSWDCQSGKKAMENGEKVFMPAPHHLSVNAMIRSHIEQIEGDRDSLTSLSKDFDGDTPGIPKILVGPVASGSAVLADSAELSQIKVQHRELIGVEMEVYGMYAAADWAVEPKPNAFALKSVCDFANSEKSDDFQRFSAYASANTLRILMERYGLRLLAIK